MSCDLKIRVAVNILNQGGLIAYPTEAVYGLGCDPFNSEAVVNLLALKKRPPKKGLILIASCMEQIDFLISPLDANLKAKLKSTWPGPLTWLIPDINHQIPSWIKGDHASVAIRVTAHPIAKALCDNFGGPIVSTSANVTGSPAIKSRFFLMKQFFNHVDYIVQGELGKSSKPSEIRDLITDRIVR